MKKYLGLVMVAAVFTSSAMGAFLADTNTFTAADNTPVNGMDQWKAPAGVVVSNNAAYLPASSALTNEVSAAVPDQAWTDFELKPALGEVPTAPATNTTTALFYCDADGYITVYNAGTWVTCSNDVWGGTVTKLDGTTAKRVTIYQNYDNNEYAVFLAGQLLLQDVPFPAGATGTYSSFAVENVDSNASLDNVWIKTTYAGGHTYEDPDGIDLGYASDVAEMHALGYAARTLYVNGDGAEYPTFDTVAEAVAVARTGDEIDIGGSYALINENITLTAGAELETLVFTGNTLQLGSLTVGTGLELTIESDLTVATMTATGDVTLASGVDLAATTSLDIGTGATLTVNGGASAITTPNLNMVAGALLAVTSGSFEETGGKIDMTGSFQIEGSDWATWDAGGQNGIIAQSLPMSEDFELYPADDPIQNYGLRGWGATSTDVKVTTAQKHAGAKALILPDGTAASNVISTTEQAVWTTYWLQPALGAEPSSVDASGKSFMSYVATNGFIVVREEGAWNTCSVNLVGGGAPTFSASTWTRVDIHQDFGTDRFALFVNGQILKQEVDFPGGDVSSYTAFIIENADNNAYIDDILVSTVTPSDTTDLDGDGTPDMEEIALKGSLRDAGGTIFRFI